jgi:hypothetical protein
MPQGPRPQVIGPVMKRLENFGFAKALLLGACCVGVHAGDYSRVRSGIAFTQMPNRPPRQVRSVLFVERGVGRIRQRTRKIRIR